MKKIINPLRRSAAGRLQGKNHEGYNCFGCSPDNPIGPVGGAKKQEEDRSVIRLGE